MPKTTIRLAKKCNLGNYEERHKFETFDISIETEVAETCSDQMIQAQFNSLREQIFAQEHESILFFLENEHKICADKEQTDDDELKL